jgi:tetratricopeptide (TPR) repeat protein
MGDASARLSVQFRSASVLFTVATVASIGCGSGQFTEVSPNEIPVLEQRLAQDPDNGTTLLRYAAALFVAEQCDTAVVVARAGMRLQPRNALGPLVVGQCSERAGNYEEAIELYRSYIGDYGGAAGAAAVGARELLAVRAKTTQAAQAALAREAELAQVPADPEVVAVLPLEIAADSMYQPLSRGLAQMLTSDLALLQRFRMVERLQVGVLMDELALSQTQQVDPTTASRIGRLLQAGRLVQGLAAIPPEGQMRLEASVVQSTGEIAGTQYFAGRKQDLMRLEKELVVALAGQMGYLLSAAERRLILENGTQSMLAFLAYSHGLLEEDRGNYSAAAQYYADAVREDPDFQMARDRFEANTMAPVVEAAAPTSVTVNAAESVPAPDAVFVATFEDAANQAIGAAELDVAATQAELVRVVDQTQTTARGAQTTASNPGTTVANQGQSPITVGTVRIIFRLP